MQQVALLHASLRSIGYVWLIVANALAAAPALSQDEPTLHQREYENGDRYLGTMHDGMRHGNGRYEWAEGEVYEGQYQNDLPHGQGTYIWPSGAEYSGEYELGVRHGKGRYTWSQGNFYEGDFHQGERTGLGLRVFNGKPVYEGAFVGGARHGEGAQIEDSGDLFLGWYERGLRHGLGVRRKPNGALWLESWLEGGLALATPIAPNTRCELIVDGVEWMFQGDGCIDGKAHGLGNAVSLRGDQLSEGANAVLGRLLGGKLRELHNPTLSGGG